MIACNLSMDERPTLGPWWPFREVEFVNGKWRYKVRATDGGEV